MKIRPKPNFGGGGAASRSSAAKPASQGSAACQEPQENLSPPKDDEVATQPSSSDKPVEESVEVISTTESVGKATDALGAEFQEESRQSCDNTSSVSPLDMTLSSNKPDLQKKESIKAAEDSEEHQQAAPGLNSTVTPVTETNVSSEVTESNNSPVPSPQAQQSPQEHSDDAVPTIISQSMTQTLEVIDDKSVDSVPSSAETPSSDKSSEASKETQQDIEAKSIVSVRRKKLKVKPVFGGTRKVGVMDKPKMRGSDQTINESGVKTECVTEKVSHKNTVELSDVKSECVKDKTTSQATSQDAGNPGKTHIRIMNVESPIEIDADVSIVSRDPIDSQPVEILESDKKADITSGPSDPWKVCPSEEKVPVVRKLAMNQESKTPAVEDKTDTPVIVNEKPRPVGESKPLHTPLDSSAPVVGSKRRPRIRALPTIVTKKKKQEDKVVTAELSKESSEVQSPREVSPHEISKGSDGAEPSTAPVELGAESSADNQTEQPKVESRFAASKKQVSFVKREVVDRKHTHLVDLTDNKIESKGREQAKILRNEGLNVTCKEKAESPLQSNIKPCRKKKLIENNEADPELEVVNVVNSDADKQGKKRLQKEHCEEIGNSDDSTGDKENASSAITEVSNQERAVRENKPLTTQKPKVKTPSEFSSEKLFGKLERKIKVEDSTEKAAKQVFRKRKDEFRKKLSKGDLEPGKMTMFDLIYWNPASNPMPGRTTSPKRNGRSSGRSDTDSIASETVEEQQVDDLGLDPTDSEHQSRPESPEVVEVKKTQEKPLEENKDDVEDEKRDPEEDAATNEEDSSAAKDIFAPRIKIGPNGEIMIDEQSIKIQTTAAKNRDEVLKKAVVVEESGDSSHYGKWSKRRRRSFEWTVKETALFYKALSTVGTDFSLMETLIKWRTRAELKTKFKKEERNNRELVDMALNDSTQFDMTVFEEESGYDPKEDRKAARQAERAEAKRRRLEMKQQDKIKEMERKKQENKKNKVETMNRKKMLRKAYRSRAKKRKATFESDNEDSPSLYDSENNLSEDSAPEQPNQVVKVEVNPRPRLRGRQPKRRNSLVISEVTVTMETVKYDKPAEQTIEESEASQKSKPPSPGAGEPIKGDDHNPQEDPQQSRLPECITLEMGDEHVSREEQRDEDEMTMLEYYDPVNEGLPESNIIESIISDNDETNPDINQMDDLEDNVPSRNEARSGDEDGGALSGETTTVLEPYTPAVEPAAEPACEDDNQKMWHFPISAIQTLEDGQQVIPVPTPNGHYSVPVPILPPGTSNVVVVATNMPDCPGEHIYHVYVVSPLEAVDSS